MKFKKKLDNYDFYYYKYLENDKDFKSELLKEVKSFKDKKLRKAWEKKLK